MRDARRDQESTPAVEQVPNTTPRCDAAPAGVDAVPRWKPEPCESCAAGEHRSYCATFPRPCEDLIEIYESGVAAGRERAARICDAYADECAALESKLQHSYKEDVDMLRAEAAGASTCARRIREGA